jgi:hypothetical protein
MARIAAANLNVCGGFFASLWSPQRGEEDLAGLDIELPEVCGLVPAKTVQC